MNNVRYTPPIKVVHLIDSGGCYGAENVILNLSREMKASNRYEPVVAAIVAHRAEMPALVSAAQEMGISVSACLIRNTHLAVDLPRFARWCRSTRVDLMHSHGYKPSVFAFLTGLLTGIPVTATCHLWFLGDRRPLKQNIMMFLELFCYRFFPIIVAVSDPIRCRLTDAGVDSGRIRVIENGINLAEYSFVSRIKRLEIRKRLGISSDRWLIVNTGRLHAQKDQTVILKAAAILKRQGCPCRFLIAGEGPLRGRLQEEVDDAGLNSEVLLSGFIPDVPGLLSAADLFVLPSLDEGMPMSLLEALAAKVPVIVTAVGDIPRLIVHKKSGQVVHTRDPAGLVRAIERVLGDPEAARVMAGYAYDRMARRFSSNVMFNGYDRIYRHLLSRKGRRGRPAAGVNR